MHRNWNDIWGSVHYLTTLKIQQQDQNMVVVGKVLKERPSLKMGWIQPGVEGKKSPPMLLQETDCQAVAQNAADCSILSPEILSCQVTNCRTHAVYSVFTGAPIHTKSHRYQQKGRVETYTHAELVTQKEIQILLMAIVVKGSESIQENMLCMLFLSCEIANAACHNQFQLQ